MKNKKEKLDELLQKICKVEKLIMQSSHGSEDYTYLKCKLDYLNTHWMAFIEQLDSKLEKEKYNNLYITRNENKLL